MSQTYISHSEQQTFKLAAQFASTVKPGDCIVLEGELGAGKTHFVKGFAQALGVDPNDVLSPTFVLSRQYLGKLKINHCDLYRLTDLDEAYESGIMDLVGQKDAVLVIEWADVIKTRLPKKRVVVEIRRSSDEDTRTITITSHV